MGKKITIISFCVLIILCKSCSHKSKDDMIAENFIHFDISKSKDLSLIDAKLLNKNKIDLEFSDLTIIPAYSNILVDENNIIVFSQRTNEIFRFDQNGKFKNLIGKVGNGPGEFQEMNDVIIHENNNGIIEVLDNMSIYEYSIEGEFLSKKILDLPAFSFATQNNQYWFYLGDNPLSTKNKLVQTNSVFSIENEFFQITDKRVPLIEQNFGNGEIKTFRESLIPKLYTLENGLLFSYDIDFGKYSIPNSVLNSNPNQMIDLLSTIEYANVLKYLENSNYSFLFVVKYNINSIPDFYYWIIDKRTKEDKLIRISDFNEDSYLLYPEFISKDDTIYFIGYDIDSNDNIVDQNTNPEIVKINIREFIN